MLVVNARRLRISLVGGHIAEVLLNITDYVIREPFRVVSVSTEISIRIYDL